MRKYETWDDIDRGNNGIVSMMTYMTLFLNDQCYNHSIELMERLRGSGLYKHEIKKVANRIEKEIERYNVHVFNTVKANAYVLADVTQSLEDDILPHIEKLRYAISQALLDKGLRGEANNVASIAETMNILGQLSSATIDMFLTIVRRIVPLGENPLSHLRIDMIEYWSGELARKISGKLEINLNEIESVNVAYRALEGALSNAEIYRRAIYES